MNASEEEFEISVLLRASESNTAAVMTISGDFDRRRADAFDRALAALPSALERLEIDVSGATLIDSAGLGCLVRAHHEMDRRSSRMMVRVGRPFQRELLRVSGLDGFLNTAEPPDGP